MLGIDYAYLVFVAGGVTALVLTGATLLMDRLDYFNGEPLISDK